jgi:hypothetical protein
MDNSDYSTQDDISDNDYGEEENETENDIFTLATATVEFVENYYMPYIAKEPCKTSSQTGLWSLWRFYKVILIGANKISQWKYKYSFTCVKS